MTESEQKYAQLQIVILSHCEDLKVVTDLLLRRGKKRAAVARLSIAVGKLERIVGNDYRAAKIARRREELGMPPEQKEPQ